MIDLVILKNFQGKSGEYTLGDLTVLSGRNGSGKSTIIKAIQLLLCRSVQGDTVKKQVGDQFRSYCSEASGVMSIEVHCDGQSIKREWTKTGAKVSTITTLNGAKIKDKIDLLELASVRIFDVAKYWDSTPSEQVEILCKLAGLDPEKLAALQKKISRVNTEKRESATKLVEARAAKKDYEAEIQIIVEANRVEDGFNIAHASDRIIALGREIKALQQNLVDANLGQAKAKSDAERMEYLKVQIDLLTSQAYGIVIPMEEISVVELERERDAMDKIKLANLNLEKTHARISRLENVARVEKLDNSEETEELRAAIFKANSGQGVTEKDKLGYEIGKEVFKSVASIDMPDEYLDMAKKAVRDIVLVYKERCLAAEDTTILQKIRVMEGNLRGLVTDARVNDSAMSEQAMRVNEIAELKLEISDLKEVGFDQELYNGIINDISSRSKSKEDIAAMAKTKDDLANQAAAMADEMLELASPAQAEFVDIASIEESIATKSKEHTSLTENLDKAKEWETVSNLREKKVKSVDDLIFEVDSCKTEEAKLLQEKSEMLLDVELVLTSRCDKVLHPRTITMNIPDDGDRVRFYLHGENGDAIESATLCGGERVAFDAALAYALVGKNGLIAIEAAEIDKLTMDDVMPRLKEIKECQLIVAGHDLARFEEDKTLTFYGM